MKKLRNNQGETLIEVLASILTAMLSVALLFSCVVVSSRMGTDAKALDSGYYEGFAEADAPGLTASHFTGTVTIIGPGASVTPTVGIYGDNGVYSYKR